MTQVINIKNMVCPRCIDAVKLVFDEAQLAYVDVQLGHVKLEEELGKKNKEIIAGKLLEKGFELLDDKNSKLINKIKSIVIEQIHYPKKPLYINFSNFLSEKLHQEYSSLSRLFSSVEGITIEQFIIAQKVEKIKELMSYQEMNLTEIADFLHYSSVAHLSAQFKKVTGMSPTAFKKQNHQSRKFLNDI